MLLSRAVRTLQYYAIVLQSFCVEPNVELHWSMQPARTLDLVRFHHLVRRVLQVECLDIFQMWLLRVSGFFRDYFSSDPYKAVLVLIMGLHNVLKGLNKVLMLCEVEILLQKVAGTG